MDHGRGGDQAGSLPMVLLVSIVMAGAIVALFTTVMTGTDTAERDRDWQSAVQVADAGIQHAFVNLRDLPDGVTRPPCDPAGTGSCTGTTDGGSFTWDYEFAPGSTTQYEISSRGEVGGSARVLEANVGPRQIFPVAMLAKESLTYNGGGGGNPAFAIGSFGSITLNGTPANNSVSSIVAYGPGPHNISAGSQQITNAAEWSVDDLNNIATEAFADPTRCGGTAPFYEVYPADVIAAPGVDPGVRGQVYCVGRVNYASGSHPITGPVGLPVEVYVRNAGTATSLQVRTGAEVNWPSAGHGEPDEHLMFIESGPVLFNSNSDFSGGIYAPNSTCSATGNQRIVGSLVCNDITVGGTFGYGTGLTDVTEGPFAINRFWEEPAGS